MASTLPLLGARVVEGGVRFGTYATTCQRAFVQLFDSQGPGPKHEMKALGDGYHAAEISGLGHGTRYKLVLDDRELPDPFARCLPDGVHAAACAFEPSHRFRHEAPRVPAHRRVIYELHVGTFTPEGTYASAAARLEHLANLGVTTVELLPISSADGSRGWGYDGVVHFAPFAPYGDPDDLRAFVDEAHRLGLEVMLDVVYNHFGPSGNYLSAYCPEFFRHDKTTPWGDAINYRHPVMRRYLLESALEWLEGARFDGLRLDATFMIFDDSPTHVLRELRDAAAKLSPKKTLIAEDDRNEPALVEELGLDAIWADDFHHAVHVTLTGERDGYYASYAGGAEEIAKTIERGWLYEGQPYGDPPRPRGRPAGRLSPEAFVYTLQNHDQIGNRACGERLGQLVPPEATHAATALLLFLPMTPLLFMGQEWGASTPFLYFTDHHGELARAVSEGRRREFAKFSAFAEPSARARIPDPQAPETFEASQLRWNELTADHHAATLETHRRLLALRGRDAVLSAPCRRSDLKLQTAGNVLRCERRSETEGRVLLVNFGAKAASLPQDFAPNGSAPIFDTHASFSGRELAAWQAVLLRSGEPAATATETP